MADINGSTKAKSRGITSTTTASRQPLNAQQSTKGGVRPLTEAKAVTSKEAEMIRDLLARMKDVTHSWPCKMIDPKTGERVMPAPFISNSHILFAFPMGDHVIKNTVTSKDEQNFLVDGVLVIPITSDVIDPAPAAQEPK